MSQRIRVLHIIQSLNYGGMERVLADIVRGCDPSRFESHVLCLKYLGRFSEGLEDVATLHLAEGGTRLSMLRPKTLSRQIARIAPDVVHSHSGVWHKSAYAARLARVARIVHTDHGRPRPDRLLGRLTDALGALRTDRVVAVSELLARELAECLWIPARKITVVSNGVDTVAYSPRESNGSLRAALGIDAETMIVGSIGRLETVKGFDVMLSAFAALRARAPALRVALVVGGEGTERRTLEAQARSLGIESAVHLPGWRDDVHEMHAAFDLFTMSSRSEGTSISLLEAMSSGLVPVVTAVGGNPVVMGASLAHRLVPSEQPAALAAAWLEVLTDPRRKDVERVLARRRVVEAFSVDSMVRGYERIYDGSI